MKYSPFEKEVDVSLVKVNSKKETSNSEITYDKLKNRYLKQFETPKELFPSPTEKDYKFGSFIRYFIRKRNDSNSRILEIDSKQYKRMSFSKNGIDKNLYVSLEIEWKLTGPRNDIKSLTGQIITFGIQDTNYRTLLFKEKEMFGISKKLSNTLEFSRIS